MKTKDTNQDDLKKIIDTCPHCGVRLSPWEKVLLSVDRMLMCKNCWYRIILDAYESDTENKNKNEEQ